MSVARDVRQLDIVIVGGGMAGLLLARLLELTEFPGRHTPLTIGVVEAQPPQPRAVDAELDLRVSALAPASLELLKEVGCLPAPPAQHAYQRMRVWQDNDGPSGAHALTFDAAELGVPALGSIVENAAVRAALWERLGQSSAVELFTESVQSIREMSAVCEVRCDAIELHARLLVGADGVRSRVRRQLGVASREHSYRQNALVAHLSSDQQHADTAWQKFLPSGPVALLPLADGRCSLVWSHPEEQSAALTELSDTAFADYLEAQLDGVLGKLRCTTPRLSFPLARGHATAYTGNRFALVGDAAHRVHPLAGQGANLGLQDVAVLAEELGRHLQSPWADPGDPRALRRYERRRKGHNAMTLGAMDGLNALFGSALAGVGGAGLGWVDRAGPVKSFFAGKAMGARLSGRG